MIAFEKKPDLGTSSMGTSSVPTHSTSFGRRRGSIQASSEWRNHRHWEVSRVGGLLAKGSSTMYLLNFCYFETLQFNNGSFWTFESSQ